MKKHLTHFLLIKTLTFDFIWFFQKKSITVGNATPIFSLRQYVPILTSYRYFRFEVQDCALTRIIGKWALYSFLTHNHFFHHNKTIFFYNLIDNLKCTWGGYGEDKFR